MCDNDSKLRAAISSLQSCSDCCVSFRSPINSPYNSQLQILLPLSDLQAPISLNTPQIKQRLVIYLPLCSSSTHNPVHSPRWLNGPQSPWQRPSAASTERGGPWRADGHSPLKTKNREEKKNFLSCFSSYAEDTKNKINEVMKHRRHVCFMCSSMRAHSCQQSLRVKDVHTHLYPVVESNKVH